MRAWQKIGFIISLIMIAVGGRMLWGSPAKQDSAPSGTPAASAAPFRMSDRIATLKVESTPSGHVFRFETPDGSRTLSAEAFAAEVGKQQQKKQSGSWWLRVFDITSAQGLLWVLLGFAGQFMFTGRMLVQWIASEKAKRSVVPPAFWWMSLFGSTMLIVYFWWRVDVVGILGQTTGWVVYIRNLLLLKKQAAAAKESGSK